MASVLGALDDAHEQRKQKPDPREVAKTMKPLSDGALQEKAAEYQKIAKAQYLLLEEKSLRLRFGDALIGKNVKTLVTSWAKNGTDPISKMEFRQHARKLVERAEVKDIDALFTEMDDDGGGSLDVVELKEAFVKLQKDAMHFAKNEEPARKRAEFFEQRADTVRAAITAVQRVKIEQDNEAGATAKLTVDARLGQLLRKKSMKASEIIHRWDPSGDGQIDMFEFRKNVRELGLEASNPEIDGLFKSLDEDGGGTLDMPEIKHALQTLHDAAAAGDREIKQLMKQRATVLKAAEKSMFTVLTLIVEDQQRAEEEEDARQRQVQEESRRVAEAKEMKRRQSIDKEAAAKAAVAEFEAKIAAKRNEGRRLSAA